MFDRRFEIDFIQQEGRIFSINFLTCWLALEPSQYIMEASLIQHCVLEVYIDTNGSSVKRLEFRTSRNAVSSATFIRSQDSVL